MDSGIKVDPACHTVIGELEKRKWAYMIMRIETREPEKPGAKPKDVVVEKEKATADDCTEEVKRDNVQLKDDETDVWYCFRTHLKEYPIAYGVAYADYKRKDGSDTSKLVYVSWNTDGASAKNKMKYSSTKVLNKFNSTPVTHQAADLDDITFNEIVDKKIGRK